MGNWLQKLPPAFFALGFFTCTWDLLLKLELAGFTLKIHSLFFALCLLSLFFFDQPRFVHGTKKALRNRFFQCFLTITIFYCLSTLWSPYPLKTFFYSAWLGFNLVTIGISAQILQSEVSEKFLGRLVLTTALFLSAILFVDSIAYQLQFKGGLLGWNQDAVLNWGISRPSAFSSEPSFVASFLSTAILFLAPLLLLGKKSVLNYLALLFIALGIFFTTSRTGLLAMLLGGAFLLASFIFAKRSFPWRGICIALAALTGIVVLYWSAISEQQQKKFYHELIYPIVGWHDASHLARLRSLGIAWQISKETHFLGTGMGASFVYWLKKGDVVVDRQALELKEAESSDRGKEVIMSTWGQLFAEGGILVLLLYLAAALSLLRSLFQRWKENFSPILLGCFLSGTVFFFFTAFWLGNVARGDVWVWYAIWNLLLAQSQRLPALAHG